MPAGGLTSTEATASFPSLARALSVCPVLHSCRPHWDCTEIELVSNVSVPLLASVLQRASPGRGHFTLTSRSSLAMAGTANGAPSGTGRASPAQCPSLPRKPGGELLSTLHCAGGQPGTLTGTSTPVHKMLHVQHCPRWPRFLAAFHTKLN